MAAHAHPEPEAEAEWPGWPERLSIRSDELAPSPIRAHEPVRWAYLHRGSEHAPAPVVSFSPFVPRNYVAHLLRNKKDRAIGVKFSDLRGTDAITNMEGALHTFVTPLVPIHMHGDYAYRQRHGVIPFEDRNGMQTARRVLLSAAVQPDFEGTKVMYALAALGDEQVQGESLPLDFTIPSVAEKQDAALRAAYDDKLRRHMVKHLTRDGRLPSRHTVRHVHDSAEATEYLAAGGSPLWQYARAADGEGILSLELLFYAAVEQVVNEFTALEELCPLGYVYTFSPPAIFAQRAGATLLNRIYVLAVAHVAEFNPLPGLRVFAFSDYADPQAIPLLQAALRCQPHVRVASKSQLFPLPEGLYRPGEAGAGCVLVIHNNSDAFGQNIETEADGGSLDGAIGTNSSAAASLHREHPRLLDHLLDPSKRLVGALMQDDPDA